VCVRSTGHSKHTGFKEQRTLSHQEKTILKGMNKLMKNFLTLKESNFIEDKHEWQIICSNNNVFASNDINHNFYYDSTSNSDRTLLARFGVDM
jgi:hypothetical protein